MKDKVQLFNGIWIILSMIVFYEISWTGIGGQLCLTI